MAVFKIKDILEVTKGDFLQGNREAVFSGISIDSRTLKEGEIFIALKGNRFDGHNFIGDALHGQAKGAIVSEPIQLAEEPDFVIIRVEDTFASLRDISSFYRRRFNLPIIAVTGSNGKTTTKEMIYRVLSTERRILRSRLNYNNQIGVSLSLLGLNQSFDAAVVELGINHCGEMELLKEISLPSIAVFTNIGSTHLEFLGTPKNVMKEKLELVDDFAGDKTVIVNADDCLLRETFLCRKRNFRILSFGIKEKADFQARILGIDNSGIYFSLGNVRMFLPVLGLHNVYNALAAITAGHLFGIALEKASLALRDFRLPSMRMNLERLADYTLIDDTYNSNPESLLSAVETLEGFDSRGRKILVCADMLELGRASESLHLQIGEFLAGRGIDVIVTIGKYAEKISERVTASKGGSFNVQHFSSSQEAILFLGNTIKPDDVVLVKGSRSMHMEEIAYALRRQEQFQ